MFVTSCHFCQAEIKAEIQKNYAKADVFFQTLNVVNILQAPLMDVRTIFLATAANCPYPSCLTPFIHAFLSLMFVLMFWCRVTE